MTLTLTQCEDLILHTLDADSLPTEIEVADIIDRAGSWLYTAFGWSWLKTIGTVGTTAAQNYVSLSSLSNPTKVFDVRFTDAIASYVRLVSLQDVAEARANTNVSTYPTLCAFNTRRTASATSKVLEFDYPFATTIAASSTGPIFVTYQAGWTRPTSNIVVPPEFEGMFIQAIRSYARGYQEEDIVPLDQRMGALAACAEMQQLKLHDAGAQVRRGPMRGGGVHQQMAGGGDFPFPSTMSTV